MTTLLTTFEHELRDRLLDLIYAQWRDLGAPFIVGSQSPSAEVIDPEALLWCSLEFLPTEPRLREGVVSWLRGNQSYVIRQRVNRLAEKGEPRTLIWRRLTAVLSRRGPAWPDDDETDPPSEPCYGLASAAEVQKFCLALASELESASATGREPGKPIVSPSTVLLRARDLLGSDVRHVLLVYLLANPTGGKLSTIGQWSGYVYRTLSETAARWQAAGVLSIEHGYCRLANPRPWAALLDQNVERAVIVDWLRVLDGVVRLLRALAKASRKGFSPDSQVIGSFVGKSKKSLSEAVLSDQRALSPSITILRQLLDRHHA